MGHIETSIDIARQLTIHTASGVVVVDEIVRTIKTFNERQPTKFILWDLTEASLEKLSASHIEALALLTKNTQVSGKAAGPRLSFHPTYNSDLEECTTVTMNFFLQIFCA
jgi:hypothetical protein